MDIKHIYYINLESRSDRYQNITEELRKVPVPYERVLGVDLRPVFEKFVSVEGPIKRAIAVHGLYFTHLQILSRVLSLDTISDNDYFAILEDDICIHEKTFEKLSALTLPDGYDMFFLDPLGKKYNKTSADQIFIDINDVWPSYGGTHFCIIKKNKIPRLIDALVSHKINDIDYLYMKYLKCCAIELACVRQRMNVFGSDRQ